MADGIKINLSGDKALAKMFDGLDSKIQKKVMRPALRAGAKIIQQAAKSLVRVGSGKLRKGIKIKAGARSRTSISMLVLLPDRADLDIAEKDKSYYPVAEEYGTKNQAGKPFLRPAFDNNVARVTGIVANTLRGKIESLAKEG